MQLSKLLLTLALSGAAMAADSSPWKLAPPPPVSWQRDRVSDLEGACYAPEFGYWPKATTRKPR